MRKRVAARMTGERETFELMRTLYPATAAVPFARLLIALLSPRRIAGVDPNDETSERVILLDGAMLAGCLGRETDYAERNLKGDESTGAFLNAFKAAVLPAFEWTDFAVGERVRTVTVEHVRSVVDARLVAAFDRERASDLRHASERVYLDNGAAFSAMNRSREHKRANGVFRGYASEAPVPLAGDLWLLLHTTPPRAFSRLADRLGDAQAAALTLTTAHARADAQAALRDFIDDPFQRYGFSPFTVRLMPTNAGVATVATPVRRALLPDCVEVDLASSQLAIAAAEWGCESLYAFLDSGASFWPVIVEWMGLDYDDAAKAAVKRAVYALVYGAGRGRILRDLRAEYRRLSGGPMPHEAAERFLTHPLVCEVWDARERELAAIDAAGYAVDCFERVLVEGQMTYGDGRKRRVIGRDAKRSLLAQRAQARELWLMEPVIRAAEAQAARGAACEWRILCWQHDGCSIRFRRRGAAHFATLQRAVAERAASVGIPTRLEVKWGEWLLTG